MVNFELSKEIEKDVFFLLTWAWDKEKILSPHEESKLRPLDSALQCSTTLPQRLHSNHDAYSPYCSLHIFLGAAKENFFSNQKFR